MFSFFRREKAPYVQSDTAAWQDEWRGLVPPECRNVPVTADGKTVEAYILINHFAVMLQDGLLMERAFFDVCEHFKRAGYHVVWLIRCTQDVYNGYLKRGRQSGEVTFWKWNSPTTNVGRWITDNREATILLQHAELPGGPIGECDAPILGRVIWATSDDPTKMVPKFTAFQTVPLPASPKDLLRWLEGESLQSISKSR